MNFKEYEEDIRKKIAGFCRKYGVLDLEGDLFTQSWIVFKRCEVRFNGDGEDFRKYFFKALDNHFKSYAIKEIRRKSREINIDDFENIECEIRGKEDLISSIRVDILTEEEMWYLGLLRQGFSLKEVAEKLGISYERVKDIWSDIKAKLNPKKRSRRELRKIWLERNPGYYKEWKEKNPEYYKDYYKKWRDKNPDYHRKWREKNPGYMSRYLKLKRIMSDEGEFKGIVGGIFIFFVIVGEWISVM